MQRLILSRFPARVAVPRKGISDRHLGAALAGALALLLVTACDEADDSVAKSIDCAPVKDAVLHNEFLQAGQVLAAAPVPDTVGAAEETLVEAMTDRQRLILACHEPETIAVETHYSLGASIRNVWGLYSPGSGLMRDAARTGEGHPDDLSWALVVAAAERVQGEAQ